MAVATKLKPKKNAPRSTGQTTTFKNLPLFTWQVVPEEEGGPKTARPYVLLTQMFSVLRKWIHIVPFNSLDGSGWQRTTTQAHVRNLHKAMDENDFTPTVWAAHASEWHMNNLVHLPIEPGYQEEIELKVSEDHKLQVTDGNHRNESLESLRKEAEKNGDVDRVRLIDRTYVTIQVFLSPEHLKSDFIRLQKGKAVSRNQLELMKIDTKAYSPEKLKNISMATEIARILNEDHRSHLFHQVTFDTLGGNLPLQFSSLIADHTSSLATTLYGGALIAHEFGKTAKWMAERYIEAYTAIHNVLDDDNIPYLLSPKQKLAPTNMGGKKGGSHLLLGIGNCLAWRMAYLDKDEPSEEDLINLQEVAARKLDDETTGGSASDKRRDMGLFARSYFYSMKNPSGKTLPKVDNIPEGLLELMNASTWDVDKDAARAWKRRVAEGREPKPPKIGEGRKPGSKMKTEYVHEQVLNGDDE